MLLRVVKSAQLYILYVLCKKINITSLSLSLSLSLDLASTIRVIKLSEATFDPSYMWGLTLLYTSNHPKLGLYVKKSTLHLSLSL